MNLFKLLNFNLLLGLALTAIAIYFLGHAGDISEANDIAKEKVQGYIVLAAVAIFGFFAIFRTIIGFIFKASSSLLVLFIIYKLTQNIENEEIVMVVDTILVLFVVFVLYALFSAIYKERS